MTDTTTIANTNPSLYLVTPEDTGMMRLAFSPIIAFRIESIFSSCGVETTTVDPITAACGYPMDPDTLLAATFDAKTQRWSSHGYTGAGAESLRQHFRSVDRDQREKNHEWAERTRRPVAPPAPTAQIFQLPTRA